MRTITALVLSICFAAHAVLGCCWHHHHDDGSDLHAHAAGALDHNHAGHCCEAASDAPVIESAIVDQGEPADNDHEEPCFEAKCSFVKADAVACPGLEHSAIVNLPDSIAGDLGWELNSFAGPPTGGGLLDAMRLEVLRI